MTPQEQELAQARQRIAELERQHEQMLLKHAKDQNTALTALETALKEIERLKACR